MHLDVVTLRDFYYDSDLGRLVKRSLQGRLRTLWPDVRGMNVVGFGFAVPFLRPFLAEAARTLCLMPAQQGVCPWPPDGPNLAALVEETLWPLPRGFADRILVAHSLETCERPNALVEETRRVLAPGGRVVCVVPNRSGLWARRDATPFGYGRPYSAHQIARTLAGHDLSVERETGALYMPPSHRRPWLQSGALIERAGQRLDLQRLAGVRIVEASLQVCITPQSGLRETARARLNVLGGLAPAPRPAASLVTAELR